MHIVRDIDVRHKDSLHLELELGCKLPIPLPLTGSTGRIAMQDYPPDTSSLLIGRFMVMLPIKMDDTRDQTIIAHLSYEEDTRLGAIDIVAVGIVSRVLGRYFDRKIWECFIENVEDGQDIEALLECLAIAETLG